MDERSIASLDLSFPTDFDGSSDNLGIKVDDSQDDDGTTFVRNAVRHERRAVTFLRAVSLGMLIVVAVIVSVSIYLVFTSTEKKTFESKALDSGQVAVQNFLHQFELKLWTTFSKAVTITSSLSSINAVSQNPGEIANYYFDVESFGLQNLDSSPLTLSILIHDEVERQTWEQWASQFSFLNTYNEQYGGEIVGTSIIEKENMTAVDATLDQLWNRTISDGIYRFEQGVAVDDDSQGPWFPIWQVSPQHGHNRSIMFNQLSDPSRRAALEKMISTKSPVMSDVITGPNELYSSKSSPRSVLYYPVQDNFRYGRLIGSISMEFEWEEFFNYFVFPSFTKGTIIVLENSCGQTLTFRVDGTAAKLLGEGDLHDHRFDHLEQSSTFQQYADIIRAGAVLSHNYDVEGECLYRVRTFPSEEFSSIYITSVPKYYALSVAAIFVFTICVFLVYDCMRERLQNKVINTAIRSNAIVNSIFPAVVRDRMFRNSTRQQTDDDGRHLFTTTGPSPKVATLRTSENVKFRLKRFLSPSPSDANNVSQRFDQLMVESDEPIADLFPNTTVMFADIVGFTAWSSEREPSQVFTLLETLYRAFDAIAKRRGVFKVETIGDCYVAVAGLPDANPDHALVMAKFAYECLKEMTALTKKLESTLGPGTGNLSMRYGLHSGPVTAGVLRGEKSRFQLFGDTVNTAARMEETSCRNKIQLSPTTAKLLAEANRSHWLVEREGSIEVKGKGEMQTFWLKLTMSRRNSTSLTSSIAESVPSHRRSDSSTLIVSKDALDSPWGSTCIDFSDRASSGSRSTRNERLIEWNTDILLSLLTKIAVKRTLMPFAKKQGKKSELEPGAAKNQHPLLDEVTEVISLPKFNPAGVDTGKLIAELSPLVKNQLHDYVSRIAAMYRDVPFHNFEHASHVTMSASKLMKRIIHPDDVNVGTKFKRKNSFRSVAKAIHECTFGLSSDPLAQFAIVFSALIHDVDHTGVPNSQLVKEHDALAIKYQGKSVAEQHSVICAWELLMDERYDALRSCIFISEAEKDRFRQLLVNATLATDICDQQLQALRKKRWDKAFHMEPAVESPCQGMVDDDVNRKATIVIEHLIQASDVAHTMQHWHIYRKWSELLFQEMYSAYKADRAEVDPSISWYEGELGFFDGYVIPLARKLEKCGIFGVSSDEYLNYALENRREWEMKGKDIVVGMVARYSKPGPPAAA